MTEIALPHPQCLNKSYPFPLDKMPPPPSLVFLLSAIKYILRALFLACMSIFNRIQNLLGGAQPTNSLTRENAIVQQSNECITEEVDDTVAIVINEITSTDETESGTIEAFHSPRNWRDLSREDADSFPFFYDSDNPEYIEKCEETSVPEKPYWFSLNRQTAETNARYWRDADGKKWRLTLRCRIPRDSPITDVHNFHSVKGEHVEILESIWWR